MARQREQDQGIGEDSFLDTIANLVGILIIFVVIIVTRSQSNALAVAQKELASQQSLRDQPLQDAISLQKDLQEKQKRWMQYVEESERQRLQRDQLLQQITQAQAQSSPDEDPTVAQLAHLETTVTQLEQMREDLVSQTEAEEKPAEVVALRHLPTPMAKTVFNKEVHVQLAGSRIAVIPWDRLVESLKREVERVVQANARKEVLEGQLGPVGGFLMQYKLSNKTGMISDGRSAGMGRMVELIRFDLAPTSGVVWETLDQAIGEGGRLRMELAGRNPKETVTTVWVYPDSFDVFRPLQERLFDLGFLTAARPLPQGVPIGAAPTGAASVAQ